MPIQVNYLTREELDRLPREIIASLLCIIGYDAPCPDWVPLGCPFAQLDMPPLTAHAYEVWTALPDKTRFDAARGFAVARMPAMIMALIEADQPGSLPLDAIMRAAYERIFDLCHGAERTLLRIWNYLPDLTGDEDGQERYQRFNAGRAEAFDQAEGAPDLPPAASALGSRGGDPLLYFLAGDTPGIQIENPRQVSAYDYPEQYGPRSPNFSRATLATIGGKAVLFISGTASVVGHESRHPGDVAAQARETIENLRAVLAASAVKGFTPDPARSAFKVYLRHAEDLEAIQAIVRKAFPASVETIFLQADICRPELLVEIEATCAEL